MKAKQKAKDMLINYCSVKDVLYLTAACPTQTLIPYVGAKDLFTEVLRKDHLPLCRKADGKFRCVDTAVQCFITPVQKRTRGHNGHSSVSGQTVWILGWEQKFFLNCC